MGDENRSRGIYPDPSTPGLQTRGQMYTFPNFNIPRPNNDAGYDPLFEAMLYGELGPALMASGLTPEEVAQYVSQAAQSPLGQAQYLQMMNDSLSPGGDSGAAQVAESRRQFDMEFPESQRQFDAQFGMSTQQLEQERAMNLQNIENARQALRQQAADGALNFFTQNVGKAYIPNRQQYRPFTDAEGTQPLQTPTYRVDPALAYGRGLPAASLPDLVF